MSQEGNPASSEGSCLLAPLQDSLDVSGVKGLLGGKQKLEFEFLNLGNDFVHVPRHVHL